MELQGRNVRKTCLSILLVIVCFMTSFSFFDINAFADNVIRTGTVVDVTDGLNFRSGPGTEYPAIDWLQKGDSGKILSEKKATTGKIWYQMDVGGVIGWASSSYIKVTETVVKEDADFNNYLKEQGFPDSYKAQLQALHAMYPNWKFEAQITNLKWADVIAAESEVGVNTVHDSSSPSSWKSTATGAYNWATGKWTEIDSGGWVSASKEIIEYYMDPRNFLDSTNVFQFLKQSYDAKTEDVKAVRENLENMCAGSFLAKGYGGNAEAYYDDIMNAGATYKVSPYVLAAMIMQEQGKDGSGSSISGTVKDYKGYYNFFNVGAYAKNGMTAVQRGLWYASGSGKGETSYHRPWNNRTDSILGGAKHYGEGFVSVGQDTMYLKKFDLVGNLYTHQYMTNVGGGCSEGRLMASAYDETTRKSELVFKIPVFKNMPTKPCEKPTGDGSPNNMLKALSVSGYSLTPSFSMYEQKYSLIVANTVSEVTIKATAIDKNAKVSGTGTKKLSEGSNKFSIKVTAQSGAKRTYTITIVRSASVGEEIPTLTSKTYDISGTTITGVEPGVSASTFQKNVDGSGATVTVYSNGKVNKGTVGTGNVIRVSNDTGVKEYTVIIYGDTNGDGKISSVDVLRIHKHLLQSGKLQGDYNVSADTNKDGKVSSLDLLQVHKHLLQIKQIKQ